MVRLSSKGQIVIPARFRRKLGLETGQTLLVRAGEGKEVIFAPVEKASRDADALLRRIRAYARRSQRDPVGELHRRRQREREIEARKREHRGH